jgi:2-dehydropantoate 2-reductase
MQVCVLGAGAVGGFIGARLAAAGVETSALARGATLAALRSHGWRVKTGEEGVTAPVRASADPSELGPQDAVILAVKAQSAASAAAAIGPLLGPATMVLSAMNGVPWWFFEGFGGPGEGRHLDCVDPGGTIAAAIPARHVIGGVVHFSCSAPEPGLVRHHGGTGLIIGEPSHIDSARVQDLARVLRSGRLDVTVSTEIHKDVWYKLWGNLTINPVSALTGATSGPIVGDELVRAFCESAMREAQEIGARIGCPIAETPEDRIEVTRKLGDFKSSMLQDAEAGRPLELDALAGAVREIGALVGVPTPTVDALYGLTRLSAEMRALR